MVILKNVKEHGTMNEINEFSDEIQLSLAEIDALQEVNERLKVLNKQKRLTTEKIRARLDFYLKTMSHFSNAYIKEGIVFKDEEDLGLQIRKIKTDGEKPAIFFSISHWYGLWPSSKRDEKNDYFYFTLEEFLSDDFMKDIISKKYEAINKRHEEAEIERKRKLNKKLKAATSALIEAGIDGFAVDCFLKEHGIEEI
jgi:hypothetical protein